MSKNDSDPKIIERLNKFPPYGDKKAETVEIPQEDINEKVEVPQEDINKKTEIPQEEINGEQIIEPVVEPVVEPVEPTKEVSEEEALANSKNPERTKEFIEKLKKQNEELKKKPNVLESLTPVEAPQWPQSPTTNIIPQNVPGLSQTQVNDVFKGLVDENGYVDSGLLIDKLTEQKTENDKLRVELKQTQVETKKTNQRLDDFERNEVMRDTHAQFPKLDPANADESVPEDKRFDNRLWEYVRKNMVSSWVSEAAAGKAVNPNDKVAEKKRMLAITQKGMDFLSAGVLNDEGEVDVNLLNMKKADKDKLSVADNAKRNINASGNSQTTQRSSYSNHDSLVQANRQGKPGALAERLRQAGQ